MSTEARGPGAPRIRRKAGLRLSMLAAAAFAAGLAIANWSAVGDRAMELLIRLGQPRLEAMQAMEEPVLGPDGIARSDWLVFFEDDAPESERSGLLDRHESVRFVDETIFSNGVVVSIPDSARAVVRAIRSSPAVWLMLKDRPFYLCH